MSEHAAFKEAVFFLEGNQVSGEMRYSEFEDLLKRTGPMAAEPSTVLRGIYAVIGSALAVRGIVCFKLRVDAEGYADAEFSVPLRHLVSAAGPGPDLGCGAIRLACRSQCPVSWHATNLWEPEVAGDADPSTSPLLQVQQVVWRNRLGIRITADVPDLSPPDTIDPALAPAVAPSVAPSVAPEPRPRARAAAPAKEHPPRPAPVRRDTAASPARPELESTLDRTFGEQRSLNVRQLMIQHNRRIESLTRKHRLELEQQQQIYLDQIRSARAEVQHLKAQLKHEQSRSQRLQQLLRGEV
jgi:hypothetical protein